MLAKGARVVNSQNHDDVIKWKYFPLYWPFVRGIHRSPVNSPHKGQWREALMFSLICARINGWVNNREAGDLVFGYPLYRYRYCIRIYCILCFRNITLIVDFMRLFTLIIVLINIIFYQCVLNAFISYHCIFCVFIHLCIESRGLATYWC